MNLIEMNVQLILHPISLFEFSTPKNSAGLLYNTGLKCQSDYANPAIKTSTSRSSVSKIKRKKEMQVNKKIIPSSVRQIVVI